MKTGAAGGTDLWNELWGTTFRLSDAIPICAIGNLLSLDLKISAVVYKFDQVAFNLFQNDMMPAAEKIYRTYAQHDDLKWEHVALLPSYSNESNSSELILILLDLTRTSRKSDALSMLLSQ